MKTCLVGLVTIATIAACGPKLGISETRMIQAPARAPDCALELVQVDITSVEFNRTWDVLGYVSMTDRGAQDPMAEENRALVRPRACKMGGSVVAVVANATNTNRFGNSASGLMYMVLRPKSAPAAPSAF